LEEGGIMSHRPQLLEVQRCIELPQPNFHAAHVVAVEDDVLDLVEFQIPKEGTVQGLPRNSFSDLLATPRTRKDRRSEDVFEDIPSSNSDSSDQTWEEGTEVSPSSCEYMAHVDSTSIDSDFFFKNAYTREKTVSRSASPVELTRQLRSGRRRRRSPEAAVRLHRTKKVMFSNLCFLDLVVSYII